MAPQRRGGKRRIEAAEKREHAEAEAAVDKALESCVAHAVSAETEAASAEKAGIATAAAAAGKASARAAPRERAAHKKAAAVPESEWAAQEKAEAAQVVTERERVRVNAERAAEVDRIARAAAASQATASAATAAAEESAAAEAYLERVVRDLLDAAGHTDMDDWTADMLKRAFAAKDSDARRAVAAKIEEGLRFHQRARNMRNDRHALATIPPRCDRGGPLGSARAMPRTTCRPPASVTFHTHVAPAPTTPAAESAPTVPSAPSPPTAAVADPSAVLYGTYRPPPLSTSQFF